MALTSAEAQARFTAAGVAWSPDLLGSLRRASQHPTRLYMERVLAEVR